MRKLPLALLILAGLSASLLGWRLQTSADDRVRQIPDTLSINTPEVSAPLMMQTKLTSSQRVLEGLLNRDFETIAKAANLLVQVAELPQPPREHPIEDRVYDHFRTEFQRLSQQLKSLAEQKNLEGAAYVHQNLTATCIACHSHRRDPQGD
jgi:hypothetical protein